MKKRKPKHLYKIKAENYFTGNVFNIELYYESDTDFKKKFKKNYGNTIILSAEKEILGKTYKII